MNGSLKLAGLLQPTQSNMNGLCGILFLVIVRTVAAGIIFQPIYPFEPDVTKYKLIEEFYPENDRDALPIVHFLGKLRTVNAADQNLKPPDGNPFFATRRDFTSPKATRRDLPSPSERPDAPLAARRDLYPYPHFRILVYMQKPSFLGRGWSRRKPTEEEEEDDAPEITDMLTTSLLKAAQKMARVMEKKLSAMNFVGE